MELKSIKIGVLLPFDYSLYQVSLILNILKSSRLFCIDRGVDICINIVQTQGQINEHSDTFFHFEVINTFIESTFDYIVIPPLASDDYSDIVRNNRVFKDWIVQHYDNKSKVYAFGNAISLLAFSGLLNGKHIGIPELKNDFYTLFPDIIKGQKCTFQKVEQFILSSSGTMIYYPLFELVARYGGNELIYHLVSKYQVNLNLLENRYFFDFEFVFETNDGQIDKVLEIIHRDYADISVLDDILVSFEGSRRSFNRRFKEQLKMTPIEYLQNIRIAHSKELLRNTQFSIEEISQTVGYEDVKSFRILFSRINGILPLEYRRRFTLPI
ncbi:MAG: helix-turn-helix domain-containing protein [Chitinophagales bacterium]|nr:helix-turn-helix domain-containing protein [Chitinophagales bacterium]